jgi:hypothetical protein
MTHSAPYIEAHYPRDIWPELVFIGKRCLSIEWAECICGWREKRSTMRELTAALRDHAERAR